eukprot:CAMPEP_0168353196 /NCGR_PEP_ID=MMETSP0213-20121227/23090_1 /TAXON_ID=151035 /ORGANISM="Euplotes harpa, Strain FSP1.4" /LENGTH=66 /DNA_ID=CAMNT_0008364727 /DNA_START=13 /DNA_END=209 /DNA_ORIENTATION=+
MSLSFEPVFFPSLVVCFASFSRDSSSVLIFFIVNNTSSIRFRDGISIKNAKGIANANEMKDTAKDV